MHHYTRRTFLSHCSVAAAAAAMPYSWVRAQAVADRALAQDLHALTAAALDAATSGGASYADAHFRVGRMEQWGIFDGLAYSQPSMITTVGLSVRALANGYWGFASADGVATSADATRLGADAATQAKISSRGKPRSADLAPVGAPARGQWVMPVEVDPFTVSFEEKADFFTGMIDSITRWRFGLHLVGLLAFLKEERTFASTDGAFTSQTVYLTRGTLGLSVAPDGETETVGFRNADFLTSAGAGWEYIRTAPLHDRADALIEDALRLRRSKRVELGRHDVVFDAQAVARLLSTTIGTATELDRVMGYQANDSGTSYINDPLAILGTFKMGSPHLTVTANRSMPGGAATVQWDEEGVVPVETTLVNGGILTDVQTTRESANWIASYYKNRGMPVRSNGCAGTDTPTAPVTQVSPNLVMAPGTNDVSFEDLVKDTKKGIAVMGGYAYTDQQALNGSGLGQMVCEIVDGKLGSALDGAQYLFRAPDFWANVVGIGGRSSAGTFGIQRGRIGGPTAHTVSAVPAKVTGVAVVDMQRKA